MVSHFLLLSRNVGNYAHLLPRDFKQVNKCVYSLDSLLPSTATTNGEYLNPVGEKVNIQIIFFVLKQPKPKPVQYLKNGENQRV